MAEASRADQRRLLAPPRARARALRRRPAGAGGAAARCRSSRSGRIRRLLAFVGATLGADAPTAVGLAAPRPRRSRARCWRPGHALSRRRGRRLAGVEQGCGRRDRRRCRPIRSSASATGSRRAGAGRPVRQGATPAIRCSARACAVPAPKRSSNRASPPMRRPSCVSTSCRGRSSCRPPPTSTAARGRAEQLFASDAVAGGRRDDREALLLADDGARADRADWWPDLSTMARRAVAISSAADAATTPGSAT